MSKVFKFTNAGGSYLIFNNSKYTQPTGDFIIQSVFKVTGRSSFLSICSKTQSGGYTLCTNDMYRNDTFEFQAANSGYQTLQSNKKYYDYMNQYIIVTIGIANGKQFLKINDELKEQNINGGVSYALNNGFSVGAEIGSGNDVSAPYADMNLKRMVIFTDINNKFNYDKIIKSKNAIYSKSEPGLSFCLDANYGAYDYTGLNTLFVNNNVNVIDDLSYTLDYKCLLEVKDKYIDIDGDTVVSIDKGSMDLTTYEIKNSDISLYIKHINENDKGKIILNK